MAIALRAGLAACCLWFVGPVWGQKPSAPPNEVAQALERLKIPADALSVVILDPQRPETALWQHRAEASVNPASLMKLVTTTAALDLLGPAFTWNTPVYVDGPIKDGVLQGNVYLRGQGDPRLVVERLWLLLRRLQVQGVARIQGDIVLDRSAFALAPRDPASFDGEPLRHAGGRLVEEPGPLFLLGRGSRVGCDRRGLMPGDGQFRHHAGIEVDRRERMAAFR